MDKKVRSIEISKQVPIVGNYDVVVCGGGPAGFISGVCGIKAESCWKSQKYVDLKTERSRPGRCIAGKKERDL